MNSILNWFLMILPFALWGTSMAAMTPLVSSGGADLVASLRLLPAGILVYKKLCEQEQFSEHCLFKI